eukprot:evm.model.scf_253EXC.10 EVM.evm.TU.scf_253EXC.10   scf_253EXC:77820-83613(+)
MFDVCVDFVSNQRCSLGCPSPTSPEEDPVEPPEEDPVEAPEEDPVEPPEEDPVEPPEEDPVEPPEEDPVEPPEEDPVEPPEEDPVEPPEEDPVEPPEEDPVEPPEEAPEAVPGAAPSEVLFPDLQICSFEESNGCSVDAISNLPEAVDLMPLLAAACPDKTSNTTCDEEPYCYWDVSVQACKSDVEVVLQDCLLPEWLVLKRFAFCAKRGSEEKCTVLEGCFWNSTSRVCDSDVTVASAALATAPKEVTDALMVETMCNATDFATCEDNSDCRQIDGECRSPEFSKLAGWFDPNVATPSCNFYSAVYTCKEAVAPDCPNGCFLDTLDGQDVCDVTQAAIVEGTFVEDADLQTAMETALAECPDFATESECVAFRA